MAPPYSSSFSVSVDCGDSVSQRREVREQGCSARSATSATPHLARVWVGDDGEAAPTRDFNAQVGRERDEGGGGLFASSARLLSARKRCSLAGKSYCPCHLQEGRLAIPLG